MIPTKVAVERSHTLVPTRGQQLDIPSEAGNALCTGTARTATRRIAIRSLGRDRRVMDAPATVASAGETITTAFLAVAPAPVSRAHIDLRAKSDRLPPSGQAKPYRTSRMKPIVTPSTVQGIVRRTRSHAMASRSVPTPIPTPDERATNGMFHAEAPAPSCHQHLRVLQTLQSRELSIRGPSDDTHARARLT